MVLVLELPDARTLPLAPGSELAVGRELADASCKTISRKQCVFRVDVGGQATVTRLGNNPSFARFAASSEAVTLEKNVEKLIGPGSIVWLARDGATMKYPMCVAAAAADDDAPPTAVPAAAAAAAPPTASSDPGASGSVRASGSSSTSTM
eukprot:gene6382-biopygen10526